MTNLMGERLKKKGSLNSALSSPFLYDLWTRISSPIRFLRHCIYIYIAIHKFSRYYDESIIFNHISTYPRFEHKFQDSCFRLIHYGFLTKILQNWGFFVFSCTIYSIGFIFTLFILLIIIWAKFGTDIPYPACSIKSRCFLQHLKDNYTSY